MSYNYWPVQTTNGTVTGVTASLPLHSSGGAAPNITADTMTGDSGTGGLRGVVPAPAAGDAAAGKFLKADGTWTTPPVPAGAVTSVTGTAPIASSGGTTPAISIANFTGDSGAGGAKGAVPAPAAGDAAAGKFLKSDGTWTAPPNPGGTITSVTGTAPIASSGGTTPAISIANFTGDSGAGGAKGAVPAPAAGDAAANKFLKADGSWSAIPTQPYDIVCSLAGLPAASQKVLIFTAVRPISLSANLAGSYGSVGVNPTATAAYDVQVNGVTIGAVSISTGGVFTFTTTGGTGKTLVAGDRLTIIAPGSQDATLADVGFTLAGVR